MAKKIKFGKIPTESDISWFVTNIGPRTHYTKYHIGGSGWSFSLGIDQSLELDTWYLTVDDEKMLTYWTLMR